MKNNKWKVFRLILIFLTIIFIIICAIKYFNNKMIEKEHDDIKTNMLVIQAKIKLIKGESEVNKNTDNYVGIKVSDANNQETNQFLNSIGIEESDFQNFYILDTEDFTKMGLNEEIKNMQDNNYIVNYNTAEVIYVKGLIINNETKYKLSDILEKKFDKKWIIYNRIEVK